MPIFLTYDTEGVQDGAGAQYQRVVALLALSRRLALGFEPARIDAISNQGYLAAKTRRHDPLYAEKWRRFLNLGGGADTDPVPATWDLVLCPRVLLPEHLEEAGRVPQSRVLVRTVLPYKIVDQAPEMYELIQEELRSWYASSPKPALYFQPEMLNVAVHVRRGDLMRGPHRSRVIPNARYVRAMSEVRALFPNRAVAFHIYSEGDERAGRKEFAEFLRISDAALHLNEDVFSTFHHLVSADVLILSRSSFSYLAGIYSRGRVLYFPFMHPPLPKWLRLSPDGLLYG